MPSRSAVRPSRDVLAATLASVTVIAHLVAAKAARDALFLGTQPVALLPRMMMLGAVVSLVAAAISSRVMQRVPPVTLLLGALGVSAVLYVVERLLLDVAPRPVALMLYVHVAAFGATFIAALWSLINEHFDPHEAKEEVARIALGGSLGGVLGGIAGWIVGGARGVPVLLVMLAALNVLTMGIVLAISRIERASKVRIHPEPTSSMTAFRALRTSPYLMTLGLFVALSATASALLDYVLSARLVARTHDSSSLVVFFAVFHASIGLLAMLVQLTSTHSALHRLGLAGTVAVVPGAVVVMGVVALFFPQLWTAVLMRGVEATGQASLQRSAYELFYTPLPREQKRPTKMLIDVGVDRVGTIAGGAATTLVVSTLHITGVRVIVALAMCVSIGALVCVRRLSHGYVQELAGRLQRGLKLDPRRVVDATTRRTLAETSALESDEPLEPAREPQALPAPRRIETQDMYEVRDTVLAAQSGAGFEAAPGYIGLRLGSSGALMGNAAPEHDDPIVRAVADLRSGDKERIRSVLRGAITPMLAAHVVPLLANDELARDALRALRSASEHVSGVLADALLDPATDTVVRQRLPRVLERTPNPRAIHALVEGLFDREIEVRMQCALALLRATELNRNASVPHARILEAIERELSQERELLMAGRTGDSFDDEHEFSDELRARAHRGIEHVMTLLALVLEREPLRLAYHALDADDAAIRGTAVEYLDNVVPERVRRDVLAMIRATWELLPEKARRDRTEFMDHYQRTRERLRSARQTSRAVAH